jgi:hypothetical protein
MQSNPHGLPSRDRRERYLQGAGLAPEENMSDLVRKMAWPGEGSNEPEPLLSRDRRERFLQGV